MSGDAPLGPPEQLPALVLAYLGDAVYELYVREQLIRAGARRPADLHRATTGYVRAQAQARALAALSPGLSPVEADVVRRGRNARPRHAPRGVHPAEYAQATAFEALVGYLYLAGQRERLAQVLAAAMAQPGGSPAGETTGAPEFP